jgi:hypothetical protein
MSIDPADHSEMSCPFQIIFDASCSDSFVIATVIVPT